MSSATFRPGNSGLSGPGRRGVVFGILGLGVAACGFTPVYGPGGAAEGLRGTIAIDPPADTASSALVTRFENRLGRAGAAEYRLSADLSVTDEDLGVTPDREITRHRLHGRLAFRLLRLSEDEIVARGEVTSFTGYSAPVFGATRGSVAGNTVSVLTAERDARERLMVILADRLVDRLLATAPDWRT